jgi:hypothetical protein
MSESDYQSHASKLATKARLEHQKWVAGLTPKQRAKLASLGVLDAADDSHEVGGHAPTQTADIAESPLASFELDMAGELDGKAGPIADVFGIPLPLARRILAWHVQETAAALRTHEADMLGIVVGGLLASNNVQIAAAGLAFATGMDAANNLGTQAKYARKLGVSRTILSKSVKGWKRQFGLRTSHHQKSEAACATYSAVTKERHWRKAKTTASELFKRINALRKKSS